MSGWQFDQAKTRERYDSLQAYYRAKGLNADDFHCQHYAECFASQRDGTVKQYSGGTAGLTPFYDAFYNRTPLRILIVGKESGHNAEAEFGTNPNFAERCTVCVNAIYSNKRNPHIKGTLITLQRIFDTTSDYVYAAYALSNALRCAFQRAEIAENRTGLTDTKTMRNNCFPYLADEIEILEPTLVVTQGAWAVDTKPPLIEVLNDKFGNYRELMRNKANGKYGLYEFSSFMLITSHHPSRMNFWTSKYAPDSLYPMLGYLKETCYLPNIQSEDSEIFEQLIKPTIDAQYA